MVADDQGSGAESGMRTARRRTLLRAGAALSCAFLLVLPVAAACAAEPEPSKPEGDGVTRVRIVAGNYSFKPNRIVVRAWTPVELIVVRESGMAVHNFVMEAVDAGMAIDKVLDTQPIRITFTPKTPGRYPFYCTSNFLFTNHRQRGMEGVLEVVE